MRRPVSRRGLTMLEVLVATVILVAVVTMVFVIMSGASNQTTTETAHMVMQEKAAKLLEEIASELRMAKADEIQGIDPIDNGTFLDATNNNVPTPVNPLSGPPYTPDTVPPNARSPLHSGSTRVTPTYKRYEGISFKTMPTDSMRTVGVNKVPVNDFDFTTKKPVYSRSVVYKSDWELRDYTGQDPELLDNLGRPDGKDNNKNGLIDERRLMRQEYKNNPPPPILPDATPIARNLRAIAFELPELPAIPERVIIHVMLQDLDHKGKLIWYYTTTTVSIRN
jgi:hypothetical protein